MIAHRRDLEIRLRRAVEDDDIAGAEAIAVELSGLIERDYDRDDREIPSWGTSI